MTNLRKICNIKGEQSDADITHWYSSVWLCEQMEEAVRERLIYFNEKYHLFDRGNRIVVGVSGGADSVCLLHLLDAVKEDMELSLYVLHVHHGIRGEEADRDARFVEKLAGSMGLPFCLVRVDVPKEAKEHGMTEEEAGRYLRYEAMENYRREVGADRIAVAHHRNDQAETVLFQLFRGSSPRGLAGIPVRRGAVIRPLLFAGREEIEEYLKKEKLSCCQDVTNEETVYTRNKIRLRMIPFAEREINSQAARHVAQAAEKLAEWRRYIEEMGKQAYGRTVEQCEDGWQIVIGDFEREDPVMQGEVLRQIFDRLIPGAKDVEQIHYTQVKGLLRAEAGRKIHLPKGAVAVREYDHIRFLRNSQDGKVRSICEVCDVPSEHIVNHGGMWYRISFEVLERKDLPQIIPQKDYTKWFDYDMIKNSLALRNPKEGDFFVLDASGSRKKLNRYYIDRKIPREKRAGQLVLAEGSHVLWAVPDRISEAYKISNNTKKVLVVTKERIRHEGRNQCID